MSELSSMLERAFENKGNKNRYETGSWSIGFNKRTWDTYFELYYNNIPVLAGNTLDKELKITNGAAFLIEKLVPEVEKALPDYHFNFQISLIIPVDFNGYWTREVENADYLKTAEECRFEDTTDGYGYDVVLFAVNRLEDVKNIIITDEERVQYSIDEQEMCVGSQGEIILYPTVLAPVKAIENETTSRSASESNVYKEAVKHYSAECGVDIENDFVKNHAAELIFCFQHKKGIEDFDCWTQYQTLLNEKLTYFEFIAVAALHDGDPFDVKEDDIATIDNFRANLENYRASHRTPEKTLSLEERINIASARSAEQGNASQDTPEAANEHHSRDN